MRSVIHSMASHFTAASSGPMTPSIGRCPTTRSFALSPAGYPVGVPRLKPRRYETMLLWKPPTVTSCGDAPTQLDAVLAERRPPLASGTDADIGTRRPK